MPEVSKASPVVSVESAFKGEIRPIAGGSGEGRLSDKARDTVAGLKRFLSFGRGRQALGSIAQGVDNPQPQVPEPQQQETTSPQSPVDVRKLLIEDYFRHHARDGTPAEREELASFMPVALEVHREMMSRRLDAMFRSAGDKVYEKINELGRDRTKFEEYYAKLRRGKTLRDVDLEHAISLQKYLIDAAFREIGVQWQDVKFNVNTLSRRMDRPSHVSIVQGAEGREREMLYFIRPIQNSAEYFSNENLGERYPVVYLLSRIAPGYPFEKIGFTYDLAQEAKAEGVTLHKFIRDKGFALGQIYAMEQQQWNSQEG